MAKFPAHLFKEPDPDPDTLANLGPLAPLAGVWEGVRGQDTKPTERGGATQRYLERIELAPIDPQTNGPQLFYGLRYHTHILQPGDPATYHDQVGYWLWEPATRSLLHSLTIPRGQVALAKGRARADALEFTVRARRGSTENGICSGGFLEANFRTLSFTNTVTVHDHDRWSYQQTTVLKIKGVRKPFEHIDRNTLRRVRGPRRNPLARAGK